MKTKLTPPPCPRGFTPPLQHHPRTKGPTLPDPTGAQKLQPFSKLQPDARTIDNRNNFHHNKATAHPPYTEPPKQKQLLPHSTASNAGPMLKNLANPKRAIYMAAGATIAEALSLWGPIELGLTPELTYQWIVFMAGPLIARRHRRTWIPRHVPRPHQPQKERPDRRLLTPETTRDHPPHNVPRATNHTSGNDNVANNPPSTRKPTG